MTGLVRYDGCELVGVPRVVIAGGDVVVQDGEYVGRTAASRFLPRPRHVRGTETVEAGHAVGATG